MSDVEFVDESGTTRLRGTLKPPPASAGGTAWYEGNNTNVANGQGQNLPVNTLLSGPPLLDIATPALPTFTKAGQYAVTAVVVTTAPLTPGGFVRLELVVDGNPRSVSEAAHPTGGVSVTAVVQVTAASTCIPHVANLDGAAQQTFRVLALYVSLLA